MKTGRQKVIGDINITPLTDVFLVLLIIMIVVNPLLQTTGVSTSVSGGDEAPSDSQEEPKSIMVNIDAAGVYSIGDEVLEFSPSRESRANAAAVSSLYVLEISKCK